MKKIDVAREQLITALDLFLQDKSPVSVHSLAGNAREIIEEECKKRGIKTFEDEIKENYPELGKDIYGKVLHQYRNLFKHNSSDDSEALSRFDDSENDHMLYIVIENYVMLTGQMTPEMQIFQLWYLSTYEEKIKPSWKTENPNFKSYFQKVLTKDRYSQKKFILDSLVEIKNDPEIINDIRTEVV